MSSKILWSPDHKDTQIYKFQKKNLSKLDEDSYESLHSWSVKDKKDFWSTIWDFTKIKGIKKEPIIENENDFINSKFFKNCKLNYTENLVQKDTDTDAIVFFSEKKITRRVTWRELKQKINKVSNHFKNIGIIKGDRIAAILPNLPETIIAFLASAQIGGIWSSCSADFGAKAIIDRFKQINPKVLIISDYYFYNNKKINTLEKIKDILFELPDVKEVIIIPYENKNNKYEVNFQYNLWQNILEKNEEFSIYENFDFNIPLYILFSSGTTGEPKCIVHGAGGSLIQHKKEHQLHCNIIENDKVFYFTTCGWMMWNWLVSCLASNATIYLYDGSPFYPDITNLFEIINNENITFFGTGAKYIDNLKQRNLAINKKYNLTSLKTIASTGSPLVHESFEYVYKNIKKNVHLTSISGGTDIVSCFVLGNPSNKVYSGEIQCKGLGMDVDIFDQNGLSLIKKKGELVCKSPFPSKPVYFWNDKNNIKYFNAYFSKYNNSWYHGDYATTTENNGYIIYGRSDATLNSGGIRIGTSEIYRVLENMKNVEECIAVDFDIKYDTKIILFIKTKNNTNLKESMKNEIRTNLKESLSPKHVPALIIKVQDIPKTRSGKIVELTVKKIMNKEKIKNTSSLSNPKCLKEYYNIAKQLINE